MTPEQPPADSNSRAPRYWMRSLSFVALHRMLIELGSFSQGLRAGELNRVIIENKILHRQGRAPKPTTLYHYRTTLLRLGMVMRRGPKLLVRSDDQTVAALLDCPSPIEGVASLTPDAKNHFATLILRSQDCLALFFGRFIASTAPVSVSDFRNKGAPVKYTIRYSAGFVDILLENCTTGEVVQIRSPRARRGSPPMVQAIPYGMRYWARDELGLIDEYCRHDDGGIVMFPILQLDNEPEAIPMAARRTARQILSLRGLEEWTVFAIGDLIVQCCERLRQPISLLYRAIDILMDECSHFIVAIPTPRSLATITAMSPVREEMELKQYYRYRRAGPYVAHIRIHRGAELLASD